MPSLAIKLKNIVSLLMKHGVPPTAQTPPVQVPTQAPVQAPQTQVGGPSRPVQGAAPGRAGRKNFSQDSQLTGAMENLSLDKRQEGQVSGARGGRGRRPFSKVIDFPEREEGFYGNTGTKRNVLTNYFRISQTPERTIYQYSCVFSPDIENPRVRRVIVGNQRTAFGDTFLFDNGSSLYLPKMIDNSKEPKTYTSVLRDGEKVQVTFNLARSLAPSDPQVLTLLNVLIRRSMSDLGFQQLNRNYFDSAAKQVVSGFKMEVWPGFVTSIRQHVNDVLMMVDSNSKVLRTDTVLDQMNEIQRKTRSQTNYMDEIKRQLLGIIVVTKYNSNTYRIDDFDFNGNPTNTFSKKGEDITYIEYYQKNWNVDITDHRQPLIITRPSRQDRNAGRMDNIVLIPELCCMTGKRTINYSLLLELMLLFFFTISIFTDIVWLTDDMRSDFSLMKNLNAITRKGPDERVKCLLTFMRRIKGNEKCVDNLQKWGLDYENNLANINARQMPEEVIIMGNNQQKVDYRADWTSMLKKGNLDEAVPCENWVLIFPRRDQTVANSFINTLRNAGRSINLRYADPQMFATPDIRTSSYVSAVNSAMRQSTTKPDIVVCILPNKNKAIYDAVKKHLILEEQCPSQCIVARTVSDQRKAMSALHQDRLTGTMIMGFDTYHDSSQRGKSVGAFISSLDQNCTKWFSVAVHHYTHEEVGTRMRPLFQGSVSAILKYREVNGVLPDKFIMYRDGVSDGQLELITNEEVPQLKEQAACMLNIEPDDVKLSYLICNKRINTRFFEQSPQGLKNPVPGLVVDNTVTRPKRFIFYIVPQSVNQGTVTPTQFVVCYHTLTLAADHMQRLAYKMCHLYYNWPCVPLSMLLLAFYLARNDSISASDMLFQFHNDFVRFWPYKQNGAVARVGQEGLEEYEEIVNKKGPVEGRTLNHSYRNSVLINAPTPQSEMGGGNKEKKAELSKNKRAKKKAEKDAKERRRKAKAKAEPGIRPPAVGRHHHLDPDDTERQTEEQGSPSKRSKRASPDAPVPVPDLDIDSVPDLCSAVDSDSEEVDENTNRPSDEPVQFEPTPGTSFTDEDNGGWQAWPGFATSMRQHNDRNELFWMLNDSCKVVRTETVHSMIYTRGGRYNREAMENLKRQIVMTTYNNRTYRIAEFDWDKSPRSEFLISDYCDRHTTYYDYYISVRF
ncbi:Piwi-like protein 1 [Nymphon striatum]|nr:Piwi-like protein 1 [Nymphon striatum]